MKESNFKYVLREFEKKRIQVFWHEKSSNFEKAVEDVKT